MNTKRQTASSLAEIDAFTRARYLFKLFRLYAGGYRRNFDATAADRELSDYARIARAQGIDLKAARLLEIGFGQFPFRLLWMHGAGIDVRGLDLDLPHYRPTLERLTEIARANGPVRALKTGIRCTLFDAPIWRQFIAAWERRFKRSFEFPWSRLIVGDAAEDAAWSSAGGLFDVIYSEDVFEHIPRPQLDRVLARMAEHLGEGGIAIIKPLIFTGISGGHDPDWYDFNVRIHRPNVRGAWRHLRRPNRRVDTLLNKLSRQDFREVFAIHFDILADEAVEPDLGQSYLTPELRRELNAYPDDELFSNKVCFVLAKKRS